MARRRCGAAAALAAAALAHALGDGGPLAASEARARTRWDAADPVEVYYAEFLLAQWVLDRSPWNAYHSGLGFRNNRTGEKALFDYTPDDTSSVMNMILPEVTYDSAWKAWLGIYTLRFRDGAHTQFFPYWPENYNNFISLGFTNGSVFGRFADWVEANYTPQMTSFQPVEVAAVGAARAAGTWTFIRSRMCHDFVTDALWVLYRNGVALKAEEAIFRDHIFVYAASAEMIVGGHSSLPAREKRKWLRYMRSIQLYLEEIKQQFTYAREALLASFKMGITSYLRSEHVDFRVKLVPPFLNYCYLPLAMPPQVHDPLSSTKLCALNIKANLYNFSAPWPWGPELAAEESLDRPEVALSLALIVLVAFAWGSAERAADRESKAE